MAVATDKGKAEPSYRTTYEKGLFPDLIDRASRMLARCTVCPRMCGVDRTSGRTGFCRSGYLPEISSYGPHFGEEKPLVGQYGSGTIFMTHCNLGCIFCQNYTISRLGEGTIAGFDELGRMMVSLQERGCHNINFVSPSHFVPQILRALPGAIEAGLSVPLVYNSSGYDSVETLRLLDGIFDIYMPDFKFVDTEVATELAQAPDYPGAAMSAIREMHRQVGDLFIDSRGIAARGLLVRHLVLPRGLAGTREVMRFLAGLSANTYVNIMDQYYPCGSLILPGSPLARRITKDEIREALAIARDEGLFRIDSMVS